MQILDVFALHDADGRASISNLVYRALNLDVTVSMGIVMGTVPMTIPVDTVTSSALYVFLFEYLGSKKAQHSPTHAPYKTYGEPSEQTVLM